MRHIVHYFWQLCLFKESPERIPSSSFSLVILLACYMPVGLITTSINRPALSLIGIVGTVMVSLAIQATITFTLLTYMQLRHRFIATFSALLGANIIMLLILLPVNFTLLNSEQQSLILLADSTSWVCLGWWLAIAGYIYHKATGISILQGSVITFITELLSVITTFTLFPTG